MQLKEFFRRKIVIAVIVLCALAVIVYLFRVPVWGALKNSYSVLTDREQIKAFITSFGAGAPFVFIIIQILQVLFAPVPGEATGFIGGYLFGVTKGFVYSSIGLSAGSLLNFMVGRFLGKKYVRKLIPVHYFDRFDTFLRHQGIVVIIIFFIFPGFPKDYLCLFLGLTTLPLKVFIILASIGRMPGTLILCFQGAYLFEKNYTVAAILAAICIVCALAAYRYRDNLYMWVDKFNHQNKKENP